MFAAACGKHSIAAVWCYTFCGLVVEEPFLFHEGHCALAIDGWDWFTRRAICSLWRIYFWMHKWQMDCTDTAVSNPSQYPEALSKGLSFTHSLTRQWPAAATPGTASLIGSRLGLLQCVAERRRWAMIAAGLRSVGPKPARRLASQQQLATKPSALQQPHCNFHNTEKGDKNGGQGSIYQMYFSAFQQFWGFFPRH